MIKTIREQVAERILEILADLGEASPIELWMALEDAGGVPATWTTGPSARKCIREVLLEMLREGVLTRPRPGIYSRG